MSIIKTHDITLYGGNDKYNIILKPLSDKYLPYLYKWNSDPEVLYWTEGGRDDTPVSYDEDTVHQMFGGVSQNAICFIIEVNNIIIGECWLQKMNISDVLSMYPSNLDVRRIDMAIGDKNYWGKGIGSIFIRMMIDFAFNGENVDVLHCFCEDYNIRSTKIWQKNKLELVREDKLPEGQKGELQFHYALTKEKYMQNKRDGIDRSKIFNVSIMDLQPSQLYISQGKLNLLNTWFNKDGVFSKIDPIPVKNIINRLTMLDGHTRVVALYLAGISQVPCYFNEDEFDWEAYKKDISWCDNEDVRNIKDLSKRIISHKEFEILWRKRCMLG